MGNNRTGSELEMHRIGQDGIGSDRMGQNSIGSDRIEVGNAPDRTEWYRIEPDRIVADRTGSELEMHLID